MRDILIRNSIQKRKKLCSWPKVAVFLIMCYVKKWNQLMGEAESSWQSVLDLKTERKQTDHATDGHTYHTRLGWLMHSWTFYMVKTLSNCTTALAFLHCLIWQHRAPAIFSGNWPVSDKINSHEPVQTGSWLGPPNQEHRPKQGRLKFTNPQTYADITCQVRQAFIGHHGGTYEPRQNFKIKMCDIWDN